MVVSWGEYYIRFEGSMYGVLHVDNEAHTVNLIPLKGDR
jgi:hypothetical protein